VALGWKISRNPQARGKYLAVVRPRAVVFSLALGEEFHHRICRSQAGVLILSGDKALCKLRRCSCNAQADHLLTETSCLNFKPRCANARARLQFTCTEKEVMLIIAAQMGLLVCAGPISNRREPALPATRHFQVERDWCPMVRAGIPDSTGCGLAGGQKHLPRREHH